MNELLNISQAAELLGVTNKTIRRWEQEGKIKSTRTIGGHRRFFRKEIQSMLSKNQERQKKTICYVRLKNLSDLDTNIETFETYCQNQGWAYQVLQEVEPNPVCIDY